MKKQTAIPGAQPHQKEKDDAGPFSSASSLFFPVVVLLALVLLLAPVVMWLSHILQEKSKTISNIQLDPKIQIQEDPVDLRSSREFYEESLKASQQISKLQFSGEADFDNIGDTDAKAVSTEMGSDSSAMAPDVSSKADTASASGE